MQVPLSLLGVRQFPNDSRMERNVYIILQIIKVKNENVLGI